MAVPLGTGIEHEPEVLVVHDTVDKTPVGLLLKVIFTPDREGIVETVNVALVPAGMVPAGFITPSSLAVWPEAPPPPEVVACVAAMDIGPWPLYVVVN
jgi:hypothetical protein